MSLVYGKPTVTNTATKLFSYPTNIFRNDPASGQIQVTIENGAAVMFLGDSAVTSATGYSLAINGVIQLLLAPNEEIYGILASGSQSVFVLVTGV